MKNAYILLLAVGFLTMGCKKEESDPMVGNWQVTQRTPYSHEVTTSPAPGTLIDIKPGYFTWTFLDNGTYTSSNTTYITVASSGRYSQDGTKLTVTQENRMGKPDPLVSNYEFKFTEQNSVLTLTETNKVTGEIAFIIKLQRTQ